MTDGQKPVNPPTEPELSPPYDSAHALTSPTFPGPVFHYTDQAGFLGIVRDKAIWASDLRYLNDSREYLEGFERIAAELRLRTAGQKGLEDIVDQAISVNRIERATGVSVASFSLAQDNLSQWRAYGSGSGGICIGFNSDELAQSILATGSMIGAVRYTEVEQFDVADKICTDILADAKSVLAGVTHPTRFSNRCTLTVQLACALTKHEKFAEEREWRVVVWSSLPPFVTAGVRPGKSTIIPYQSVRLDAVFNPQVQTFDFSKKLPLDTIWIGPTPHPTLAVRAAKSALTIAGESAKVQVSKVPFRNW